jgi:multidrug efflux system membrane fusion protein
MTDSSVRKNKPWWKVAATVTLFAGVTVAFAGCKRAGGAAAMAPMERPPAPVTVVAATSKDVPIYLSEIGTTSAIETVNVQPQVGGKIMEIHFKDGADVKKGDKLFTIDPRWFDADFAQSQAMVAQRTAELALAKQEFERVKPLLAKKAISQQEYDTKESQVAVVDAQLKAAQAAVETARLSLEYTQVKSPIEGRTGRRLVDVGNVVKANDTTLLTIQRLDPIYVDFTTSERNLPTVRQHMAEGTLRVEVQTPNETAPPATGDLTFLDTMVQPGTGTIKLRATLKNERRRFWAGQFVEVRLILQVKKDAVLVPSPAVQIGQQGPYVYVVKEDHTAELRPIEQGQRQGELVVINRGVGAGEKVITTGHMMVMPGAKVKPLPQQPAGGMASATSAAPAEKGEEAR